MQELRLRGRPGAGVTGLIVFAAGGSPRHLIIAGREGEIGKAVASALGGISSGIVFPSWFISLLSLIARR
jgi:hypothetical protein